MCDTSKTAVVLPRYAKRMLVIDVAAVINSVVKVKLNGSDASTTFSTRAHGNIENNEREKVNAICRRFPGADVSDPWGGGHDA